MSKVKIKKNAIVQISIFNVKILYIPNVNVKFAERMSNVKTLKYKMSTFGY